MAHDHGRQSLLGNGYRLDLVSFIGMVVLRREDGTEVARFRVCDAISKAVEQAARQDRHMRSRVEAKSFT